MAEFSLGVRRVCDTCKKHYDFPTGNLSEENMVEVVKWIGTVGFTAVGQDQLVPFIRHFCCREHASEDLLKPQAGSTEAGNKDMEYLTALAAGKKAN